MTYTPIMELYNLTKDLTTFIQSGNSSTPPRQKKCCGCPCHSQIKVKSPRQYPKVGFESAIIDEPSIVDEPIIVDEHIIEENVVNEKMILRSECKKNGGCNVVVVVYS